MAKLDLKQLKKAARELNETFGLDPAIDLKGDEATLIAGIKEALQEREEGDEFTKESEEVFETILASNKKAGKDKPASKKKQPEPEEEEDEEELEDDDIEDVEEVEDEEDEEEEVKPAKKSGKKAVKEEVLQPKKSSKKQPDPEPEPEEEVEEVKPAKKGKSAKAVKEEPVVEEVKPSKKASKKEPEPEVEEKKPSKKEKPVKEEKTKPAKKEKVVKDKSENMMYQVRKMTALNPSITVDEIVKKLEKAGFENINKSSVTIRRSEMLYAIDILKEAGKLK